MDDGETRDIESVWREERPFLVGLAFKMLGDFGEAEDVVQDAFTRLLRVDLAGIEDARGWLIVVVSRLCLDVLRSARSRRQKLGDDADATISADALDPADRVTLDDNIRIALLVVLERLSPAERTVFVLHDMFQYSFESIAEIVGRSTEACRQLASRARRRIETQSAVRRFAVDPVDEQRVVERFIAACAGGDLDALLEVLDPDVVGVVDLGVGQYRPPQIGRDNVANNALRLFSSARGVILVSYPLEDQFGALAFRDRELSAVLAFEMTDGRISDIHAIADPVKLAPLRRQLGSNS